MTAFVTASPKHVAEDTSRDSAPRVSSAIIMVVGGVRRGTFGGQPL